MGCKCCCTPDKVRDGCSDTGAFITGFCCTCLPRRVCVSLFTEENACNVDNWSAVEYVSSVEASWCDVDGLASREYVGVLTCGTQEIDFRIAFYKDSYNHCYIYLESEALGYVGEDIQYLPMGGDSFDVSVKKSECSLMEFTWNVQVYGTAATITISPADNVVEPKRRRPTYCLYNRACITYFDGYEEVTQYVCFDEDSKTWSFDVDDDPNKNITITLESDINNTATEVILSLTSYLGNGDSKEADCPKMYAKWEFENGNWVKIIGDNQAKCTDCKYYCRCLCVTYSNGIDTIQRDSTCVDNGYDGCDSVWTISFEDQIFTFKLRCIGCETLSTVIEIEPPSGLTVIGSSQKTIICPDQLTASWSLSTGGSNTIEIDIECKGCGNRCTTDDLNQVIPCCPERTTGIPTTLYATIESSTGCPQLNGQTITLIRQAPFNADTACWYGSKTVSLFGSPCIQKFALMCTSSDGETDVWRLVQGDCGSFSSSTNTMTVISCDPFELLKTVNGVSCCDDGIGASITIRITE